ncbi:unnamed protein product [Cylindrotheca closterium]|uniref:Ubiquitin-like domain-containing protein n=1 Tax=Cylindrotheca closterium TaxID=2856 RepID=A0AAD2CNP3_9STRA|nr:unnamed protein product [Cylindrotheca closterium]
MNQSSSMPSSSSSSAFANINNILCASTVAWSTWWELPPTLSGANDKAAKFPTSSGRGGGGGALRLLHRCQAEYGWDLEAAKRIVKAYKDFLHAASFLPSNHWLMPCPLVDQIWQLHIWDTQHYESDCQLLMGRIVHYNNYLLENDNDDFDNDNDDGISNDGATKNQQKSQQEHQRHQHRQRRRRHKRQLIKNTIQFICEKTNQEQLDPKVWQFGGSTGSSGSSGSSSRASTMNNQQQPKPTATRTRTRPMEPISLKRDCASPITSNDSGGDENNHDHGRRRKKIRLTDSRGRRHPWKNPTSSPTTNTTTFIISVQIHCSLNSKKYYLEQQKDNQDDAENNTGHEEEHGNAPSSSNVDDKENQQEESSSSSSHHYSTTTTTKLQTFHLEKHAPLNRIFQEVANAQELDRNCLHFTYNGQILEGDETPHALSKYYGGGGGGRVTNKAMDSMPSNSVNDTVNDAKSSSLRHLNIECSPVLSEC